MPGLPSPKIVYKFVKRRRRRRERIVYVGCFMPHMVPLQRGHAQIQLVVLVGLPKKQVTSLASENTSLV